MLIKEYLFKNGYIQVYHNIIYAFNTVTNKNEIFISHSVTDIKRIMKLRN